MKLRNINGKLAIGAALALACTLTYAAVAPVTFTAPAKIYFGLFGGFANPNDFNVKQYGTVFFSEVAGGPNGDQHLGQLKQQ